MIFYLLLICVQVVIGQLVLGPCPVPPPFVENLDMQKYSGDWYIVAQSRHHPLSAPDCAKVTYAKNNLTLSANFSYVDRHANQKIFRQAELKTEFRKPSGHLALRFQDFPRSYQFRVLKSNYSNGAIEYTCLSGVFNYTASVTVLHRRPQTNFGDLNTTLYRLNVTSEVPPHLRKDMKIVSQSNC